MLKELCCITAAVLDVLRRRFSVSVSQYKLVKCQSDFSAWLDRLTFEITSLPNVNHKKTLLESNFVCLTLSVRPAFKL
jgi:hypothetical protein